MSVLFECTCSQTILKTYIISYCTSSAWRLKERRLTSVFCISVNGQIQSRIGEENLASLQVQMSRQFKSTIHDDFAFVRDRGGFKTLYEALWITSGSHITSILQNSTIPDNKWSKFSFIPFKDVEEISHFRVISKWTPESDKETADQIRRLISFPVPLELRFGETSISRKIFSTTVSTQFFFFFTQFFFPF